MFSQQFCMVRLYIMDFINSIMLYLHTYSRLPDTHHFVPPFIPLGALPSLTLTCRTYTLGVLGWVWDFVSRLRLRRLHFSSSFDSIFLVFDFHILLIW